MAKVGDYNLFTGRRLTQEDIDRQNAAIAQLAVTNPDIDLAAILDSMSGPQSPLAQASAAYKARIAEEEAEAARIAEAQAAEADRLQAEADRLAAEAARLAAEAEAAIQNAENAYEAMLSAPGTGQFAGPNIDGAAGYIDPNITPEQVTETQEAQQNYIEAQTTADTLAAQAGQATEAAAQADAIANPLFKAEPFKVDVPGDGSSKEYWGFYDPDGNFINLGTRHDGVSSGGKKYEEYFNDRVAASEFLINNPDFVPAGELSDLIKKGDEGGDDLGKTWGREYVNTKTGETIVLDLGVPSKDSAEIWDPRLGSEGRTSEGLGGAINKFIGSGIGKGLLAVATGGLSVPYTTAATVLKGVSDGNLNAFQAFAGLGGFTTLTNNIINDLPNILGKEPPQELINTIKGIGSGATTKDIVLGAVGINEAMDNIGKEVANAIGEAGGLSTGAIDGIANTFTNLIKGQDLDNAIGNALTTFATTPKEEIEKNIDVDVEGYQQLADSLEEAGLTGVGDLGGTGATTPTTDETEQFATAGGKSGDQVDTGSIFYPPEVDTTSPAGLGESGVDDTTPSVTAEGDAPVIKDSDTLETPTDATDAPVIKTAEEELADLGLTDGAPPVRPTEILFGSLYSEAADNSLTFKGTDPAEFIKKLAKDESTNNYQAEYSFINEEGELERYVGLLQFGEDRLEDYNKANNTNITLDEFKNNNELQDTVNAWHINDIDELYDSLDRNKTLDAGVTKDGFRAMAHLGGRTGAINWINTGGEYDPDDPLGTRLSDYNDRFGGAFVVPTTDTQIADAEDTLIGLGTSAEDAENIIDQITTTEDEAEEGTGVDLSGQEQEDLSDPTRFTGPIGAGIGPETTDEDFQNQLADILEGQGTGVYTAGAQPSGDAFEIGEGIKPPVPVGLEEKIDSLKETFANLADQSTDLYNQAMGINIPGLTNMFDEPATMSDIFSGDIQGLDTDAIKNAADAVATFLGENVDFIGPAGAAELPQGAQVFSLSPTFDPNDPEGVIEGPGLGGAGLSAAILTALAGGSLAVNEVINQLREFGNIFVKDPTTGETIEVPASVVNQAVSDFESGTYDEIGPLITGTGFDDSGVDEFAGMFTDATGSPYIEGTTIPYASQAAADGANIMSDPTTFIGPTGAGIGPETTGTGPKVVDDLGIDIPASGTAAGATLTDIVGDDTSPVIGDTPTLGTPAGAGTTPIISTTADTAPITPDITDETDQFATAGTGITPIVATDTNQTTLDDITSIINAATSDGGETIGQDDTDIGVGAGVGAGVIGTGDVTTGVDTTTGIGTDVVTGTQTGTETIADTAVLNPVLPTLLPPVVPPLEPIDISPVDPIKEEEEGDPVDEIRNILYGQQVKVEPSGVADIPDPYDFSSIFGNTGQQNRFTGTSPYGTTDQLLNFLRSIS